MRRGAGLRRQWTIGGLMILVAIVALPIGGYVRIKREMARREQQRARDQHARYLEALMSNQTSQRTTTPQPRPTVSKGD